MIRQILAVLSAAFVLAACDPHDWNDPNRTGSGQQTAIDADDLQLVDANGVRDNAFQEKLNSDPTACKKLGGEIMPVCMRQNPMCVITFEDAGKACSDSSDCKSGRCLGDMKSGFGKKATGACAATNNPCGCFQMVVNGEATPGLCVD